MSSGERGKPAATYKERNPFDISRRSETEVAAEIAQRMAAWKQARGRSYATPSAAAAGETKPRPAETKQKPSEPKQPHIAAPVQPARLPKFGETVARAPQPAGERVPLFAIRRAMPPAPSLKQPPPAPADSRADKIKIDSLEITPALLENLVAEHPGTEAAKAAAEALRAQRPAADPLPPAETPASPSLARAAKAETPEKRESEVVAEEEAFAPRTEEPVERAASSVADSVDSDAAVPQVEEDAPSAAASATHEPLDEEVIEAPEIAPPQIAALADPAVEEAESEPSHDETREGPRTADPLVARWEDSLAAISATPAARRERNEDVQAPWWDEPVVPVVPAIAEADRGEDALVARRDEAAAPAAPAIAAADRSADDALRELEMPRLDAAALEMRAAELAMAEKAAAEAPEREDPHLDVRKVAEPEVAAPSVAPPASDPSVTEIVIPADLTAKATVANAQIRVRLDGLPRMETRIEQRRIDTLRADPWIAGRRPVFPHIDPEVWDVPPPEVAARANRQRSGASWAIGLGTLLLIAGITAPAAIWQGRQQSPADQDQAAALTPPAPQPAVQPTPAAPPPQQAAPQQAAPPQQAAAAPSEPPAPAVPAPSVQTSSAAEQPASTSQRPAAKAPTSDEATSLSAIKNGGELNPAPITAPPSPKIAAEVAPAQASKPKTDSEFAGQPVLSGQPTPPYAFVAHPFVPEATPKPAPFRPEQSAALSSGQPVGAALGAAAGAAAVAGSVSVPVEGGPAIASLKPSLSGQLKPTMTSEGAVAKQARQVTRKPRPFYPQSLDQMFQDLVDTLSEGQPANPATKPLPPGSRR